MDRSSNYPNERVNSRMMMNDLVNDEMNQSIDPQPADQKLHACTFTHWDDQITFASKIHRFPSGRGPRGIACTQDCSFCAVK